MSIAPPKQVRILVSSADAADRAVQVSWADWHPTVADLASAVGLTSDRLWVDDQLCLPDELIDSLDLHDGSIVADRGPSTGPSADQSPAGERSRDEVLAVEHIAGASAGAWLEVEAGLLAARPLTWTGESSGAAGPRGTGGVRRGFALPLVLAPPAAVFEVVGGAPHESTDDRSTTARARVSGARDAEDAVSSPGRSGLVWRPGELRALGVDLFMLHRRGATQALPLGSSGLVRGQRVLHRSPRILEPIDIDPVEVPVAPKEPSAPPRLSWAVMLAPLPIGILIALLFRPIFLLFTALGPVMALGRWLEGRIRHRRDSARWRSELLANDAALNAMVASTAATHAAQLRGRSPTIGALAHLARSGGAGLWERRPDHDDFGEIVIGYEDRTWSPPLTGADRAVEVTTTLRHVPHTLLIDADSVVGVVGAPVQRRAVARAIVLQLAALHGPADLTLDTSGVDRSNATRSVGATPGDPRTTWDWCKWLPHSNAHPGGDSSSDNGRLEVSLDGDPDHAGPTLVEATAVESLPARCTQVVVLEDGMARVLDLARGNSTDGVVPVGCSAQFAEGFALALAPVRDGDAHVHAAPMPPRVSLVELDVASTPASISERWRTPAAQSPAALQATLGSDGTDVVVDLVADGPHSLVAGTTGSGKSELLRTLVTGLAASYPPERCTFVLVDFKGGGAFDVLAPLPHVAAVVTDLDAGLAERALRSLRAELRRREHRLREASVSDLRDCPVTESTPPRLVIVVDEFATLANDAPDFLDGLIDTAQRGRSLGVHLVLATQRPAGVVDNRIRANTNLRICLRVGDATDSRDVIGTVEAAELPTSAVGRAWMRAGPEQPHLFQCAHIGPGPTRPEPGRLAVAPFGSAGPDPSCAHPFSLGADVPGPAGETGKTESTSTSTSTSTPTSLIAAIAEAGADRPRNPPPWIAPLPEPLMTDHIWGLAWGDPTALVLGRYDLPDEQSQPVCSWEPRSGALVVIGGSDQERAAVAGLVEQAVMERNNTHGVDFAGVVVIGRKTPTHARVDPRDTERVSRALDWFTTHRTTDQTRPASEPPGGAPVLVIEDYARLCADAEQRERASVVDRVNGLISGADAGGVVVVMAGTERALPPRVLAACGKRIVLRLPDPSGYAALGVRLRTVPDLGHLGGVDAPHGTTLRLATPTTSHVVRSPEIRSAPRRIRRRELAAWGNASPRPGPSQGRGATDIRRPLEVAVGIDLATLAPYRVVLGGRPLLVVGEQGSGRTSTLATIIESTQTSDLAVCVAVTAKGAAETRLCADAGADYVRAHDEIPELLEYLDTIKQTVTKGEDLEGPSGRLVVVVDDADALDQKVSDAFVELASCGHLNLIAAGTPRLFRSPRSSWSRLADARFGIALGRGSAVTDVYGPRSPWYPGTEPVAGDATVVDGDTVSTVRLALADAAEAIAV